MMRPRRLLICENQAFLLTWQLCFH
uniref:Uncharacterized protein n=1 Tax=Rhizophora mucronata TaxID=61149 RepID=A0A2P2IMW2_RHIMU